MAGMTVVSPGYLDLLRVTQLRGRPLLPEDREGSEFVALASQAFVDRYWPGEDGIGKLIQRDGRVSKIIPTSKTGNIEPLIGPQRMNIKQIRQFGQVQKHKK